MSDDEHRTRRQFIRAAVAAGAVGTAGCLRNANGDTYVDPMYATPLPDRWDMFDTIKREASVTGLTTYTKGTIYSDSAVRKNVKETTLGAVDTDLVIFAGAQINLEGAGAGVVEPQQILETAQDALLSRIESNGITNIEATPASGMRIDRVDAHQQYMGTYTIPEQTFDLPVPNEDRTERISLPGADIPIRIFISVIDPPEREDMLLVAGAYPTESYTSTGMTSLSGDEETGVNVSVDINLELDPDDYEARLTTLIENIELR